MPAVSINHINIKAPAELLKTCRDFYVQVVGLRDGHRPEFNDQGYWLYAQGSEAVIHMTVTADRTSGVSYYDHIAFNCTDLPIMQQRLRDMAVAFTEQLSADGKRLQIFMRDPCDLGVELNFTL